MTDLIDISLQGYTVDKYGNKAIQVSAWFVLPITPRDSETIREALMRKEIYLNRLEYLLVEDALVEQVEAALIKAGKIT